MWPIGVEPLEDFFAHLGPHAPLDETERAAARSLAIPIYAEITPDQQTYVAESIASFFREPIR